MTGVAATVLVGEVDRLAVTECPLTITLGPERRWRGSIYYCLVKFVGFPDREMLGDLGPMQWTRRFSGTMAISQVGNEDNLCKERGENRHLESKATIHATGKRVVFTLLRQMEVLFETYVVCLVFYCATSTGFIKPLWLCDSEDHITLSSSIDPILFRALLHSLDIGDMPLM